MAKIVEVRNSTAEFERYRIIQDRLFRSDFEKMQLEGGELPELPLEGMTEGDD